MHKAMCAVAFCLLWNHFCTIGLFKRGTLNVVIVFFIETTGAWRLGVCKGIFYMCKTLGFSDFLFILKTHHEKLVYLNCYLRFQT